MDRLYKPYLRKEGLEREKYYKRREYVYMPTNTDDQPLGNMDILLVADVEGLGMKWDRVSVSKTLARELLLPGRLALYASAENEAIVERLKENEPERKRHKSVWAQKTIRQLANMTLPIPMCSDNKWILQKRHVRLAFRLVGVHLNEDCITLPENDIVEPGEVTIQVTVNDLEVIPIKAVVYHWYENAREAPGGILPSLPPVWSHDSIEEISVPDEIFNKVYM